MHPAFGSTRHAAAFGGVLVLFLVLPIALHSVGGSSLEEAYRGISERAGAFDFIRRQIFEDHSELDIVFCGTSLLGGAIHPKYVERELSRALGRQARVELLPQSWQGPDLNYFVARDLMEHRKVKMLVIAAPAWVHRVNQPHVQLFRIIRYGDHPGALDGLGLRNRLAIYAGHALGAPRHALSLLRSNLIDPNAGLVRRYGGDFGYEGGPFVRHEIQVTPLSPETTIYSAENRDVFHFDGPPLNPYQLHFIRKTVELTRQYHAPLVILHMPSPSERGRSIVPDRQGMPEVLGKNVFFAGIPSATMFARVPSSEFLDYFSDEHLNSNGMNLYTQLITPSLVRIYERYVEPR